VAGDAERQHALDIAGLLLILEHEAVAAGPSAAHILGLEFLTSPPRELVVVTDHDVNGYRRSGYLLRSAVLPDRHLRERHGVPITSGARTVVDLARQLPFKDAVVVADSALRRGRASLGQLRQTLQDCYSWPGIGGAQRVVAFADKKSGSVLESVSRVFFHEVGIPAPLTQQKIGDEWEQFGQVDFLWEEVGVIGEADGLQKYEPDERRSTRDKLRAEKRREHRLMDAGYELVRWGWEDLNRPAHLARRLWAAFGRGEERKRGRRRR
ncbi:MAG: hypothetical protein ACRDJ9_35620, partial [Dehalococcoidia bacterium]